MHARRMSCEDEGKDKGNVYKPKKHQRTSENHQKPGERHRTESKKEGAKPDSTLVSGFQLPEL